MQDHGGSVREDEAQSNGETHLSSPACVLGFCSAAPRPLSLRAGGWRFSVPPPRTGCLFWTSPPQCCCRAGGGQGTQPLAQSGFPGGEVLLLFFCLNKAKDICCHPLRGGVRLILFFFVPWCCKGKLGRGASPSLSAPLQGKRLLPHQGGRTAAVGPNLGHKQLASGRSHILGIKIVKNVRSQFGGHNAWYI